MSILCPFFLCIGNFVAISARAQRTTRKRPVRLVVRTPPFHGGNRGSNPLRVATLHPSLACGIGVKCFLPGRQSPSARQGFDCAREHEQSEFAKSLIIKLPEEEVYTLQDPSGARIIPYGLPKNLSFACEAEVF